MFLAVGLVLGGCAQRHEYTRLCMGVPARIVVYAADERGAREAAAGAFARMAALDAMMSDYRPASDLNRLSDRAGEVVKAPRELVEILALSQRVSASSGGAFDVTVGPMVRLWREARRSGVMPPGAEIEAARGLVGWRMMEVDPAAGTVGLARPGMRLDLGSIAKGYAAQRGVDEMRSRGYPRVMVGLAGDIVAGEAPPGAAGWRVAIAGELAKDRESEEGRMVLLLRNAAVSTSGDVEQFVEIEGRRYSHIVDPATGVGMSASPARSATVVARAGEVADAISTAACLLGSAEAERLAREWGVGVIVEEGGTRRVVDPHGLVRAASW